MIEAAAIVTLPVLLGIGVALVAFGYALRARLTTLVLSWYSRNMLFFSRPVIVVGVGGLVLSALVLLVAGQGSIELGAGRQRSTFEPREAAAA